MQLVTAGAAEAESLDMAASLCSPTWHLPAQPPALPPVSTPAQKAVLLSSHAPSNTRIGQISFTIGFTAARADETEQIRYTAAPRTVKDTTTLSHSKWWAQVVGQQDAHFLKALPCTKEAGGPPCLQGRGAGG